ncbi:Major facilitator superfamily domain general substrate transporter [Penicillium robsamsonii]|uniref:Major facilitator superfamily domain general substrate transporter n=1 Tax=Penicillium robsamsonii TaxID=1792511 RepID=UPI002546E314|nr:Major facilitator superfamily domain general substrate transporter [Penicillium robsamsonii]KAJ5827311.1 Major facilitator superfamily domain general substrate transporter [Penicillium robsamsonii]
MFIAFKAAPSSEEVLHGVNDSAGVDLRREPARRVVGAKSNVMERSHVKPVDGTKSLSCVAIRTLDHRKAGELNTTLAGLQKHTEKAVSRHPPENIANFSRDKLLELVTTGGSQYSHHQDSSIVAASLDTRDSTLSGEMPGLESLHTMPEEQPDEIQCASAPESVGRISDDVNALSLSARHPTSYLGVSSIQAALKVIAWLHPSVNSYLSHSLSKEQGAQPSTSLPPSQPTPLPDLPPTELEMLDAYFLNFQPFAPLIDEEAFRTTYLLGRRKDDRWLALLNIVLALGNITAAGADNHTHCAYYERSMDHLNLRSLGDPSLEVVQALGLLGGWYCHYISQPNLAYSLMGASLRMAVTLGLQREPSDIHSMLDPKKSGIQEFKRRVWWSLCCLETWGHETLGRPSMDYFGPSITVNLPSRLDRESYFAVLPLTENIQFVKIALKIQESLAALPTLSHTDMFDLDSQLVRWWHDLPPVLKDYEPCPESLHAVRTVMRWRYYNHRMLLYRPTLLNYAMRRIPFMAIRVEERTAIQKCQEIAEISIQDISSTIKLNQMIGWNAVWMLFQATMVPLICLSAWVAEEDPTACKTQVETAMLTLGRMKPYGHTAGRSLEVISGILESNLHGPTVEPLDVSGDSLGPPTFLPPNAFNNDQQIARDRVSDWTATSFETLSSQHMWEYLSWDHSNLWPEVFDLNAQNENVVMSFLDSSAANT